MTSLSETTSTVDPTPTTNWTAVGTAFLVLTPLLTMAADLARMWAEQSGELSTLFSEYDVDQSAAMFVAIDNHFGLYQVASWLALAAALATIPGVAAVRALTERRSPRWSVAALVTGICLVIGQFAHLMGYYVWNQILVAHPNREAAIEVALQTGENVFGFVVFAPYLIGVLLFWPFAAVALWRSRAIPVWALVLVLGAAVVTLFLGSSFVSSTVRGLATFVGLTPALGAVRHAPAS